MRIGQTTIERMAWWVVVLVLVMNIAIYAKLTIDDNRKFHQLKSNQDTLLCITKGFIDPSNFKDKLPSAFIKTNR